MRRKLLFLLGIAMLLISTISAKKVHTLGDSTMAFYNENVTETRGWGMYFGNFLTNGWTAANYAIGGRDSRGGFNELWQNAKGSVEAGDYVLIQFAHNDGKYNGIDNLELQEYYTSQGDDANAAAVKKDGRGTTPSTTYKACLKQIVDAVREKGAMPVLVSAVCRCYFSGSTITRAGRHDLGDKYDALVDGEYKKGLKIASDDHTMDYSYQMQQLATELDVPFIDMTTATKNLYESYGSYDKCYAAFFDKGATKDNTHYNLTGALTAARLCAQLLKDAGILADAIEIPTDLAFSPATLDMGDVYVGQSAMKELTLSGLGLEPSAGSIRVAASEGIMLSADKQNWQEALQVSYESGTVVKTFYARMTATAAGQVSGTVTATIGDKTAVAAVTMNAIELGGGAPFTASWPLTSNDDPVVSGSANAATAKVVGMVKYGNNSTSGIMVSTSEGGAWVKAEDDSPNQYVEFKISCPDGQQLDISRIAMKVGGRGGNGMRCHVYYSTDGFNTRTTIYAPPSMTSNVMNDVEAAPVIKLDDGDQLQIRVYPWYTGNAAGKWLCIKDVEVDGQSKTAGVNITGSVSYKLDKGGLAQGDDVVMDPQELTAGFVSRKWTAGSLLTVEGTKNYRGALGEANIPQTRIANETDGSFPSAVVDDNTLTLTLIPEDGFSFVPAKLSFEAARYGTNGGNISASVEAGETHVDLVNNAAVNRDGKDLTIASFTEEIAGVTATADNPLKVKFSFLGLGKTKEMGLSNVVIEGTLVGAASKVTKYPLHTLVLPSAEAGTISREPDMEQYKEGTVVTLKANKNFGYKFIAWQDEADAVVSTKAETTVTMDAEKTMKAVFEKVPVYSVKTKVTNADEREIGSITLIPNEHDGQYEAGTRITATADESKILKFLSWTDQNENAGASVNRELTVDGDMELVADFEVQDFIAVFDASTTASYAYPTTAGYPFAADLTWDASRNAKACVVKVGDGSLAYTQDGGTPVVRNRQSVVLSSINGLYQNGYRSSDIAFQYQFSTTGFISATFTADMAAKNMAHKNWKALISTDGQTFTQLGESWEMAANVQTPISLELPQDVMNQQQVIIRFTGDGTDMLSDKYAFDKQFDGLDYCSNSECGVGNVYVLGTAEVIADEIAPKVTATVPADHATGVSATGRITISFDERIKPVDADAKALLNDKELTATWNSRSVSFAYSALDYDSKYTFTMPANFIQDRSGNKMADVVTISFTTMKRPAVAKASYDFIVPDDGTITEALAAANSRDDKSVRYRVFIKNSDKPYVFDTNGKTKGGDGKDYDDPRSYLRAPNTSFIGESTEGVVITNITPAATWDNGFGPACPLEGIGKGDVLIIEGNATNSYFQNLTLKSSMGDKHGRDIVLHDYATHTIFKDACLWAYQDTYVSNKQDGAYYFEGGIVRGRTDFICGSGDVFFNAVDIVMCEKGGYIVAPQGNSKYGYVFKNCTIKGGADDVDGTYYLGRAWSAAAETYFINTTMMAQPAKIGWHEWNNGPTRFAEYNSVSATGAAIDLSMRATTINGTPNEPVLTAEEAATIGDMANTFGDWQPTLATEQAPVPQNLKADGCILTWDDSNYALLYAIVKDGKVIDFTTQPSYTVTAAGVYAVRAANEMGGLSASSQSVTIDSATGISAQSAPNSCKPVEYFTIDGRKATPTTRGLLIVRDANGAHKQIR